jgi:hypothetical protein
MTAWQQFQVFYMQHTPGAAPSTGMCLVVLITVIQWTKDISMTTHWHVHNGNLWLLTRQEAVILARDLEPASSAAVQTQDGAFWGGVHITALYAEEAHIKAGEAAAPPSDCENIVNTRLRNPRYRR